MVMMWGFCGGVVLDDEGFIVEVIENILLFVVLIVNGGFILVVILWWDGVIIVKNVFDVDVEVSFVVLVSGLNVDFMKEYNDKVIWLIDGF